MSYELFISGKPVGQIASQFGMADLDKKYPADGNTEFDRFLRDGYTRSPAKLREAIVEVLKTEEDKGLKEILITIKNLLPKQAKLVSIG